MRRHYPFKARVNFLLDNYFSWSDQNINMQVRERDQHQYSQSSSLRSSPGPGPNRNQSVLSRILDQVALASDLIIAAHRPSGRVLRRECKSFRKRLRWTHRNKLSAGARGRLFSRDPRGTDEAVECPMSSRGSKYRRRRRKPIDSLWPRRRRVVNKAAWIPLGQSAFGIGHC
jgi:hypothetical protein